MSNPTPASAGELDRYALRSSEAAACLIDTGAPTRQQVLSRTAVDGGSGADRSGHGTAMVDAMRSVWSQVRIRSVRATDSSGSMTPSDMAQGMRICASYPDVRVIVVASTWDQHRPAGADRLEAAIAGVHAADVSVVAASGNEGRLEYPASLPQVISVGAVDEHGKLCAFSSGVQAVRLLAVGCANDGADWGTSPASAQGATVLVALASAHPDASREELEQWVTASRTLRVSSLFDLEQPPSMRRERHAARTTRVQLRRPRVAVIRRTGLRVRVRLSGRPRGALTVVSRRGSSRVVAGSLVTLTSGAGAVTFRYLDVESGQRSAPTRLALRHLRET